MSIRTGKLINYSGSDISIFANHPASISMWAYLASGNTTAFLWYLYQSILKGYSILWTPGILTFQYDVSGSFTQVQITPSLNAWHHFVWNLEDAGRAGNIYADGVLAGSIGGITWSGFSPDTFFITGHGNTVGVVDNDTWDDVRFYSRILSSNEVETIYNCRGNDSIVDGLVSRYDFREKTPGTTTSNGDRIFNVAPDGGGPDLESVPSDVTGALAVYDESVLHSKRQLLSDDKV